MLLDFAPIMFLDADGTGSEEGSLEATPQEKPPVKVEVKPFDPTTLSPEIQKYIDQQRTNASKTSAENARKKAITDPEIVKSIREQVEKEANQTVEEKNIQREKDLLETEQRLSIRQNKLDAKERLVTSGFNGLESDSILDVIATSDSEITLANTDMLIDAIGTIVAARVAKEKETLLQGGFDVQSGGSDTTKTLQMQYDEAKKNNNTLSKIKIKREAMNKGVTIQE